MLDISLTIAIAGMKDFLEEKKPWRKKKPSGTERKNKFRLKQWDFALFVWQLFHSSVVFKGDISLMGIKFHLKTFEGDSSIVEGKRIGNKSHIAK